MYDRIIVPLDGTPFGEYAVTWATEIAIRSDALLELVHIHVPAHLETDLFEMPVFHYTGVVDDDARHDRAALRRETDALEDRARLLASATGLRVKARTVSGNVDLALEREAKSFGADLVVMSTHARTGFERARFGSIGDAVVRHSTVPVLLVRPPAKDSPAEVHATLSRLLVGLDGSLLSEQILTPVSQLASLFGAQVVLAHVEVPPTEQTFSRVIRTEDNRSMRVELTPEQYLEHVAGSYPGLSSPTLAVRRAPSALHGMLELAGDVEPDMFAFATHARRGLKRILLGSTAGAVLGNSLLPVLLYRPRHRSWGRLAEPVAAAASMPTA